MSATVAGSPAAGTGTGTETSLTPAATQPLILSPTAGLAPAAAGTATSRSPSPRPPAPQTSYPLKQIQFGNYHVSILLQTHNGPCPLLAISNILLILRHITFPPGTKSVAFNDLHAKLLQYLQHKLETDIGKAQRLPESRSEIITANLLANHEIVLSMLPLMESGLDVNPRFEKPTAMEYTSELATFDSFGIRLLHTWCVDPHKEGMVLEALHAAGNNYNSVTDYLTKAEDQLPSTEESQAARNQHVQLLQDWLSITQSQVTQYGVQQLQETLKELEMAILFRANHFSVLIKRHGVVYQLISDAGLAQLAPECVWSIFSVDSIKGDETYCNYQFQPITEGGRSSYASTAASTSSRSSRRSQHSSTSSTKPSNEYLDAMYGHSAQLPTSESSSPSPTSKNESNKQIKHRFGKMKSRSECAMQ